MDLLNSNPQAYNQQAQLMQTSNTQYSLNPSIARNLAHSTKSVPMMEEITPRWLLSFLPWVGVEAGVYRVNRRKKHSLIPEIAPFDNNEPTSINAEQLSKIPPFMFMNCELLEHVTPFIEMEQYNTGATLTKPENEGDILFLVGKGKIEVSTKGIRGEKLNIGMLSNGDFSDIDAFLEKSNRPITMRALTPCTLFTLNRNAFENMKNQSPKFHESFNNAINKWAGMKEKSNAYGEKKIQIFSGQLGESNLPQTYADYEKLPREYPLSRIQTVLKMNTQVSDLFNTPINQLDEQMRLTVEAIKEKQEWEIINNADFGLVNSVAPSMRVQTRKGVPTPDDMDELLAKVWKKPAFFLAHPKVIAAFGRECTRRGVPPVTVNFFGSPFITWRGVPIVPCDKLLVNGRTRNQTLCGTSKILLMRVGEKEQGVIGLHQPGIPDEKYMPSLSVKCGGIDYAGIASYILSLYFSTAVLTDDALGMLEDVEVGYYHDYE